MLNASSIQALAAPRSSGAEPRYVCERCGCAMIEHHCKIRCPNCGYIRDCSDPRTPSDAAPFEFPAARRAL